MMAVSSVTKETRKQSFMDILVNLGERQRNVLRELYLYGRGITANELAVQMHLKGYFPTSERNFVHPRLNELVKLGHVTVVGKRICTVSGKRVAVYKIGEGC